MAVIVWDGEDAEMVLHVELGCRMSLGECAGWSDGQEAGGRWEGKTMGSRKDWDGPRMR